MISGTRGRVRSGAGAVLLAALVALLITACGPGGPREVVLGEDECGFCRMTVTDARFATQAITKTGRIHVFDSVDCMLGYARSVESGTITSFWVTDANSAGTFVAAEEAGYLLDGSLRGPMGRTAAFATPEAARAAQASFGGTAVTWATLLGDSSQVIGHAH